MDGCTAWPFVVPQLRDHTPLLLSDHLTHPLPQKTSLCPTRLPVPPSLNTLRLVAAPDPPTEARHLTPAFPHHPALAVSTAGAAISSAP